MTDYPYRVAQKWQNWARTATAKPKEVSTPSSVDEVSAAVLRAAEQGRTIRMIGSGHSFTSTAVANDIMLRPGGLANRFSVDQAAGTATVGAGMDLTDLCERLDAAGLALTNMGDIRVQTLAGALQTGTHGTGRDSGTFAEMVVELEIVTADGAVVTANATQNSDLFNAARVGLGAFGIVTAVTLAVEPRFRLHAHEFPAGWEETLVNFNDWTREHDHVEFYWFPHTDRCLVKHNDRTTDPPAPPGKFGEWWEESFISNTAFGAACRLGRTAPGYIPFINRTSTRMLSNREYTDASWRVFTSPRRVKFAEMEYSLPREALLPALQDVRSLMDKRGWRISFPVEVRSVPADTAWLSPATQRDTGYLAFHAFDRTDRSWFTDVEDILRDVDGRPHWGKLNTRSQADIATAYPNWHAAMAVRERVDPNRVFANEYVTRMFGE